MRFMTSHMEVDKATYSASVINNAIVVCNLEAQMMGQFAKNITYPGF